MLSRRKLLAGTGALAAAGALDAFGIDPRWLELSEHAVPVSKLPRSLEGLTVMQITDAHLTTLGVLERSIAQAVRARSPQLVVLSGDIVDSEARLPALMELCSELAHSGAQLFATFGNWEHWGKVSRETLSERYRAAGVRLLVNETVLAEGLSISATDDALAGSVRWDHTLKGLSSGPRLLVTHSPALLDRPPPESPRFDLCMAGHTHGGQVRAGSIAPLTPPGSGRFVAGEYDTPFGPAYVSRGTGTSVVPARFCCRPELPLFRWVRA